LTATTTLDVEYFSQQQQQQQQQNLHFVGVMIQTAATAALSFHLAPVNFNFATNFLSRRYWHWHCSFKFVLLIDTALRDRSQQRRLQYNGHV
jgi:hypothetical protein